MNKKILSSSDFSGRGEQRTPAALDVADVPTELLEIQYLAQQIQQRSVDQETRELARQIEQRLDLSLTAISAAVEQLAEVA